MTQLRLVVAPPGTLWERRTKGDPAAVALADRHYSRQLYGRRGGQVGPPGRLLVLVSPTDDAVWVSHWPAAAMALDRLDAWRCVLFRNEGAELSSTLVRAAMAATAEAWGPVPFDGWLTWVRADAIRSTNPGYCFQRAGWVRDREWTSTRRPGLVRLRWPAPEAGHTDSPAPGCGPETGT